MARYFFDVYDNGHQTVDSEGSILANLQDAQREAIGLLGEIARDLLRGGSIHELQVKVHLEDGEPILEAFVRMESRRRRPENGHDPWAAIPVAPGH